MYSIIYLCTWTATRVEVRGQFVGVNFLFPPCGSGGQTQALELDSNHLYTPSHLVGHQLLCFNPPPAPVRPRFLSIPWTWPANPSALEKGIKQHG